MNWYQCNKCFRWKPEECFYSNFIENANYTCKECGKESRKLRYNPGREIQQVREWQLSHKQQNKEYHDKYSKEYSRTPKGKEVSKRRNAKRRNNLEFNPLNKWFLGSVGHHINNKDAVYILEAIHLKFYTQHDAQKHRDSILQYYGSLDNMINNIPKGYYPDGTPVCDDNRIDKPEVL